jgi:lipoprotein-anchoring transpeptidase ErfK/SrfK
MWLERTPYNPEFHHLNQVRYGSWSIGRSASHGCIRLANWDAARVVNQVTVGMTVEIY